MYSEIKKCRICNNDNLVSILSLGEQTLTGVFPKSRQAEITTGPLELVKCFGENSCGLVQLRHSYDLNEMYGENYGYRSGLNNSMIEHLRDIVNYILKNATLGSGDIIIDVGSNDGTLLKLYPSNDYRLVGIDPTGNKFKKYYPDNIRLIPDFFSKDNIVKNIGIKKVKVISSISMFYDLEHPMDFMKEVHDILDDNGIWVLEQSYLPTMLEMNAYDTICHEHLEYYALKQIKWMTDKVGLKLIDVELNSTNGGSFFVVIAKEGSFYTPKMDKIEKMILEEEKRGIESLEIYKEFKRNVFEHKIELEKFIKEINSKNEKIFGYGASTKGNVILQFCNLSPKEIPYIAEINEDKFGSFTPKTMIPIISEVEARSKNPDYLLVLPWHFRDNIIKREQKYLSEGGKLVMPLPRVEVISYAGLVR